MVNERKLGNVKQMRSYYHLTVDEGESSGKRCVLVHNGEVEALFSKDNALDIVYLKYKGINISFLSKCGFGSLSEPFSARFEGGFLYTCGIDNVGASVEGKIMHGSLHTRKCDALSVTDDGENIRLSCRIGDAELFGKNLQLYREYTVRADGVEINDTIVNEGYSAEDYVLLYHINFGYPFLDECTELSFDSEKCIGRTDIARRRIANADRIDAPVDCGEEDVFYRKMRSGRVRLTNTELGIFAELGYSTEQFPWTIQWKSMISGDYALGIEPSVTRFDEYFEMQKINPGERVNKKINVKLGTV